MMWSTLWFNINLANVSEGMVVHCQLLSFGEFHIVKKLCELAYNGVCCLYGDLEYGGVFAECICD